MKSEMQRTRSISALICEDMGGNIAQLVEIPAQFDELKAALTVRYVFPKPP